MKFDGIRRVTGGRRMVTDPFNKVEVTNNIYALGDTCIQSWIWIFQMVIRKWRKLLSTRFKSCQKF
jgi:hypothetical protein